ncbi:MAG TPA: DUF748 domain-containing protein [Holophagaceae bacterium]
MPTPASLAAFLRRRRRLILVLAGLYGLWILAGFLLVPRLVRPRVERALAEATHRKATLARVRFNPFNLAMTLEGLRIPSRSGGDWIGLRRLYVNARFWPLLARTASFSVVELDGLDVRTVLDAQGHLNFQDLLESPAAKPEPAAKPSAWTVAIGTFQLREARLAFEDHSTATPFRTAFGPVNLRVDGIRTQVGHQSGYALDAWTEAKEHLVWKGEIGFEPFASTGHLAVENLQLPKYRPYEQEQVATEIRSGTATLGASYRFEWAPGRHRFELSDLGLALRNVAIAEPGAARPALVLPALDLKDGRADLLAPSVEIGSIAAQGGSLLVQRGKDGALNLARMFTPKPKPKAPDEKPLDLKLRSLDLTGFTVGWDDQLLARPVKAEAKEVALHLGNLSLDPAGSAELSLALRLGNGSLKAEGKVSPLKPAGDLALKVDAFDLAPWDPYLDGALDARVDRGAFGFDGRVAFAFPGTKQDGATVKGDATVRDFQMHDTASSEPFIRWTRLQVAGLDLRTAPLACTVKQVAWTDPEGRLVVGPDGTTNVAHALRQGTEAKPAGVAASAVPPTSATAPDIAIAKLAITGGRLSFVDRSLQPNAALLLSDLAGSYLGLSSRPDASSKVDFTGRAGGLAPVTIQGHAMPLRHDLDTDVTLKIHGADLTDFTPYTGKYLGYTVQKGKLEVEARLRIQQRKLDSENAVKLDQFYLGDKVASPDATHLPVKLGLALLRDRHGVIAIDLPIQGSLDDPDIKYGKLVWQAIFNVLGKIATSPFTLVGKLFGGEAGDLSQLAFAPGSDALDAAATAKLQALAKALAERPALSLEARGEADPAADGAAFRKAGLEALLRRTRAAALKLPDATGAVPSAERDRWIQAAFVAAFPPAPPAKGSQPAPPPPPTEMESRLLDTVKVDPADLAALADARAKRVLAWLLDTGKADPARVFQVREGGPDVGPAVVFTLK